MKILFALDDFPPVTYTSASVLTYNFAKELLRRGHEVFVITSVQKRDRQGYEEFNGLKIFRIFSSYNNRLRPWLSLYNPKVIPEFKKRIENIKPDICHFHHIHKHLSYYCFKLAKKNSKAVFLTAHDVMLIHYNKLMPRQDNCFYRITAADCLKESGSSYNPFRNLIIRHYLKYIDKIFTVSDSLKRLLEINGIKNTEKVYNFIRVEDWQVDVRKVQEFKEKNKLEKEKLIIFAARLIEAKGGDKLIESLSLVNKVIPGFKLLIIGKEWAYTKKLKLVAERFGIGDKIIFTGHLKEQDLKTAYNSADISVFPSLCFETFGMTNLEAMACKKPVISTIFGGPSEVVIDGKTGYLINPNNAGLMAGKIIDLLKNPQKAKQFGEAGYQRAKTEFSLQDHTTELLKWYSKSSTNG